jgi:hypothetical protein
MSFLILAVCHLQYLAHDAWRAADSILVRVGATLLNGLFPNFQLFSVGDRVASGQSLTVVPVAGLIAYGLAYGALYLFFACACFRRREL